MIHNLFKHNEIIDNLYYNYLELCYNKKCLEAIERHTYKDCCCQPFKIENEVEYKIGIKETRKKW